MATEARLVNPNDTYEILEITSNAALEPGDVLQAWNGQAGVRTGTLDSASGDVVSLAVSGEWKCLLTDSIAVLNGTQLWWDESANRAHIKYGAALGVATADVTAGTDQYVTFTLNGKRAFVSSLQGPQQDSFTITETNGLGVTVRPGGVVRAQFDNTSEAATASVLGTVGLPSSDKWIWEGILNIIDDGTSVIDINFGMANAAHATDFDSVTENCVFHFDGGSLNILAESTGGGADVSATDTTVDHVLGTPTHFWIDARQDADLQLYVNGVLVLGSTVFRLDTATGPLYPVFMVEKTTATETCDIEILDMNVRRVDTGGAS
jgi:hypothetical protein